MVQIVLVSYLEAVLILSITVDQLESKITKWFLAGYFSESLNFYIDFLCSIYSLLS